MPSRGPVDWSVDDVQEWLTNVLQLPDTVTAAFKENAVAGTDLIGLSDEDLTEQLGCKPLQARKIRQALVKMGFNPPGAEAAAAEAAATETAAVAAAAPAPAAVEKEAAAPVAAAPAPPPAGYPPPAAVQYAPPPGAVPAYGAAAPPPAYVYPPPPMGVPVVAAPAPPPPRRSDKSVVKTAATAAVLIKGDRNMRKGFLLGKML